MADGFVVWGDASAWFGVSLGSSLTSDQPEKDTLHNKAKTLDPKSILFSFWFPLPNPPKPGTHMLRKRNWHPKIRRRSQLPAGTGSCTASARMAQMDLPEKKFPPKLVIFPLVCFKQQEIVSAGNGYKPPPKGSQSVCGVPKDYQAG